ncbi:MAG: hypothetical protein AB1698_01565 [Pseudomonadota bacterium]
MDAILFGLKLGAMMVATATMGFALAHLIALSIRYSERIRRD